MPIDIEVGEVVLNKIPVGIIVYDRNLRAVFTNRAASHFLKRYALPEEVPHLTRRIFDAMESGDMERSFPGEVYLYKRLEGSSSNWIFKFFMSTLPKPIVGLFIMEETVSQKMDMNHIRRQFGLTRRETDILRRVLDGHKNVEIAEELEISEQTVKDHLSNVYMKTGVENRFDLVRLLMNMRGHS